MERTSTLLVEDLRDGDVSAFDLLVERYRRRVYRIAIQITKNHEDANDVTQETFLKVYESIRTFRAESSFETWLYRIAVNQAINTVKRRRRRRESFISQMNRSEIERNFQTTREADPQRKIEKLELQKWISQAIDSLSLKHRTVVILHEFEGLTHSEIASILNCSEGTVRSRLHYARKQLRERLKFYVDTK